MLRGSACPYVRFLPIRKISETKKNRRQALRPRRRSDMSKSRSERTSMSCASLLCSLCSHVKLRAGDRATDTDRLSETQDRVRKRDTPLVGPGQFINRLPLLVHCHVGEEEEAIGALALRRTARTAPCGTVFARQSASEGGSTSARQSCFHAGQKVRHWHRLLEAAANAHLEKLGQFGGVGNTGADDHGHGWL